MSVDGGGAGGGTASPGGGSPPKTLGVVGTLVWDTIHRRDAHPEPLEEWGGIGYAIEALSVSLPDDWGIVPIVKVGRDLWDSASDFLAGLPRVRVDRGLVAVDEPNNRVELHYEGSERRRERLSGGVPPWNWFELAPRVAGCDALYVNFISGFEMELETARSLHDSFDGPLYADLHSLFLGVGSRGDRIPRPLPMWDEWLQSFDAVQMNEKEFTLLARRQGDPWALAARCVGPSLKLVVITLGARGAAYVAAPELEADPFTWPPARDRIALDGPSRSALVETDAPPRDGDPTGCGDVWGATTFARLLAGDPLERAMGKANRIAGRNVEHRGARGLGRYLAAHASRAGEIS